MSGTEWANNHWAMLYGVGGILVSIGFLWARLMNNISATGRLFKDIKDLSDFKAGQVEVNKGFVKDILDVNDKHAELYRMAAARYESLSAQLTEVIKYSARRKDE